MFDVEALFGGSLNLPAMITETYVGYLQFLFLCFE